MRSLYVYSNDSLLPPSLPHSPHSFLPCSTRLSLYLNLLPFTTSFDWASWHALQKEGHVAVALFEYRLPDLVEGHRPVVKYLLQFFIVGFDVNVKPGSLPVHNDYESDEIARIRTEIVSQFTLEYRLALMTPAGDN